MHLQAIVSVYSSKIPTKSSGMLTYPLKLANPASGSTHPSSCLLSSADWPILLTSLFCLLLLTVGFPQLLSTALFCQLLLTLGPSFSRPLPVSGEISHTSPLCVFHAKTDKGIFWLALTHTHTTNAQHRVTLYLNSDLGLSNGISKP